MEELLEIRRKELAKICRLKRSELGHLDAREVQSKLEEIWSSLDEETKNGDLTIKVRSVRGVNALEQTLMAMANTFSGKKEAMNICNNLPSFVKKDYTIEEIIGRKNLSRRIELSVQYDKFTTSLSFIATLFTTKEDDLLQSLSTLSRLIARRLFSDVYICDQYVNL